MHIIINLIELIYYKTVDPNERYMPFTNKKVIPTSNKSEEHKIKIETVYDIACEHLHVV